MIGAFFIPVLLSYGNVLMHTMKNLDENTVALYMNPALAIIMFFYIRYKGQTFDVFADFGWLDWFLTIFFSVNTVIVQTLKFKALQNEEPGKLSHYQYLGTVYQLVFDVFFLGATFMPIQWAGLAIMFFGYGLQVFLKIRSVKK